LVPPVQFIVMGGRAIVCSEIEEIKKNQSIKVTSKKQISYVITNGYCESCDNYHYLLFKDQDGVVKCEICME